MRAAMGLLGAVRGPGAGAQNDVREAHAAIIPNPGRHRQMNDALEAAVFRRLLAHLDARKGDVQNIDLMTTAGFCRNCLADWYREAAAASGLDITREAAREHVYGMPYDQWKARYQRESTSEQVAAMAQRVARDKASGPTRE
jgi:hypothetical protein